MASNDHDKAPTYGSGSVFKANRTQAVRIPRALAFPEGVDRVTITAAGRCLVLCPEDGQWDAWGSHAEAAAISSPGDRPGPDTRYLLTPGAVAAIIRADLGRARAFLESESQSLALSRLSIAEGLTVASRIGDPLQMRARLEGLATRLPVLPFGMEAALRAHQYGSGVAALLECQASQFGLALLGAQEQALYLHSAATYHELALAE